MTVRVGAFVRWLVPLLVWLSLALSADLASAATASGLVGSSGGGLSYGEPSSSTTPTANLRFATQVARSAPAGGSRSSTFLIALRRAAKPVLEGASRLTGANRAVIDPRKFTDYLLSPSHPVGQNKARVFESAFGFNRSNADDLVAQLRSGVVDAQPIAGKVDQYGSRFTVDIPVAGPKGSGVVRAGFIYDPGSVTPRLTTAFPR